jgi:hypothetical protein
MTRDTASAIAGLLAGFVVASLAFLEPPAYLLGIPLLVGAAYAWVFSVAATSAIAFTLTGGRRAAGDPAGVVAAAVWFAPAVLFVMEGTLWSAVVVSTAACLAALLFPTAARVPAAYGVFPLFGAPEPSYFVPHLRASLWPAVCVAAALVFALAGDEMATAVLSGAVAAYLASKLSGARPGEPARRRLLVSAAAAVLFTAFALARYVQYGWGGAGGGRYASGSSAQASSVAPQYRGQGDGGDVPPEGDSAALGGTYSGVILWPERDSTAVLVPPLPALSPSLFQKGVPAEPLSIPFYGVYWMYRKPFRHPPPNSYSTRGDPAKQSFRSTDNVPLLMEARQNLGRKIDARCCREIRLAVRNADRYPGTLYLELQLVNTDPRMPVTLSLGQAPLVSTPPWGPAGQAPVPEIIAFKIPSRPIPEQFDELRVIFHRSNFGVGRSARVAIDRFTFLRR